MYYMKYSFIFIILLVIILISCGKSVENQYNEKDKANKMAVDSSSPQKVLQSLTEQIRMNPSNYGTLNLRSEAYYHLDSMDKALADIEKSLAINDSVADTHYLKGFYSAIRKDTALAIKELQTALDIGTMEPEVSYQLAQILMMKNEYAEAGKLFDMAIRMDSMNAQYVFGKGLWFEKQKKYAEALKSYQKSISRDSLFQKPYIQLHNLYQTAFHSDADATKWLDRLLKKQPNHPLGNFHRGNDLFQKTMRNRNLVKPAVFKEEMEKTIASYTRSIGGDPNFAQASYERGYCYFVLEEHEKAMKDFEQVIAIQPNHAPAEFMLGSYFEHYGDKPSALIHYKKALAISPNFKDAATAIADLSK